MRKSLLIWKLFTIFIFIIFKVEGGVMDKELFKKLDNSEI